MSNPDFYPWIGSAPEISDVIQLGRGVAAAVIGQTYNVFRLSDTTNDSVLSGTPVFDQPYPVIFKKESRIQIENEPFALMVMVGTCDNRDLVLGDILVETGFEAHAGNQFIFVQYRPPRDNIFVRVENNSGIQRPRPDGGAADQEPTSGWVAQNAQQKKYGGITPFIREILTLKNGLYAFHLPSDIDPDTHQPYTPATVPIGIQPRSRTRDRREPDLPTVIAESEFYGFCPAIPGVEISETDVIKAAHQDNYEVRGVASTDQAGLQGYVLLLRKLAS